MPQIDKDGQSTTGSDGLDHILAGGFTPNRLYLVEGDPGAGKTTLALRYLLDGAAKGDKETRIFLRADKAVPYGEMMEVMNLLRTAGYLKVALVGLEKVSGP